YMILPIYAGLERIPNSLISASEDLGASPFTTFRRVILPLVFPAVVAGSIFTFSLTLGDYITPRLRSHDQFLRNVVFNHPLPAPRPGSGGRRDRGDGRPPPGRPPPRPPRAHLGATRAPLQTRREPPPPRGRRRPRLHRRAAGRDRDIRIQREQRGQVAALGA